MASRSISQGTRAGLIALSGTAVGFLAYLLAAASGLAALFDAVPAAFIVIKVAGALYLLYLAWQILRPDGHSVFERVDVPDVRPLRLFGMGLLTNLLNPKIALLYAALLPQFTNPNHEMWPQFLILGGVQIIVGVLVNGAVVCGAGTFSDLLRKRPRVMKIQRLLSGTVLTGFAVKQALERQPA